jgi:signal transduction histidine kinase
MVLNSARQMVNLITELLDISAIESGKVNIDLQRNNLNLIFEECERIHRKHANQKNINLIIDKNDQLPSIMIDKSRIAEVVDNLLSNAIKYTYPDGEVRLYTEIQPNEICVHIRDSGQGLNETDLNHIFKSYKKLSARPTGGESSTGFGLAIVKKIVELHHGRVWVESKVKQGSTFSFSIPLTMQ